MSSRTTYDARTPEFANFSVPHTPISQVGLSNLAPASKLSARDETIDAFDEELLDDKHTGSTVVGIREKVTHFVEENAGLLYVTGSQALFSFMNVAVKVLNGIDPPVPTLELVAVRMIITYICCMVYMLATGVPDPVLGPKEVRGLLVVRGFIGFFGLFGVYYSLQYLSLSDATVLTFLAPMCTAMAGAVLLGETFTRRQAFAGIVSLVGVVLIARPAALFGSSSYVPPADGVEGVTVPNSGMEKGTPRDRLIAVGVALIGVLGATGAYISIRAIGKRAHPLHSMTFFSAYCVIISSGAIIINKTQIVVPTQLDWLALLIMIGIFGFGAQTLLTMGLQRETAGRGTMAVYTQIVFASILERIFFRTVPTALSVTGTLLIICSALYVALSKEKDASSKTKQKPNAINLQQLSIDAEMEEGLLNSSADHETKQQLDE
ncbi:EamA-like transporter family-domain-containing protein [Gymnopilus junonius]|uniref:EamA-like transporter family-domain-containing protein n=1 Tax=Gymnopilus junonius TaxID=109634 RepID=A0A9P5NUC6_GYMJU|nr:EamA-like transporter family-domain-containing protein [Gymnopilus junonius]